MLFWGLFDFWPTIDLLQPPKATESYRKLLKVNIFQNPQSRIIPPFSPTTASYRKPKVALVMSRSCVQVASAAPRRGKSFDLPYFFFKIYGFVLSTSAPLSHKTSWVLWESYSFINALAMFHCRYQLVANCVLGTAVFVYGQGQKMKLYRSVVNLCNHL